MRDRRGELKPAAKNAEIHHEHDRGVAGVKDGLSRRAWSGLHLDMPGARIPKGL
jgi:hypothetical protein